MCWRHQNFQMSTITHQTTVPSTHPKIQSPKSTGQSTWSSHLRASHLRALFYTLLSQKWKWNTCGYFLNFTIWRPVSKYYVHDCLKKQFFCSSFHKNFQNLLFFALLQVENFLCQIFRQSWSKYLRLLPRKRPNCGSTYFIFPSKFQNNVTNRNKTLQMYSQWQKAANTA